MPYSSKTSAKITIKFGLRKFCTRKIDSSRNNKVFKLKTPLPWHFRSVGFSFVRMRNDFFTQVYLIETLLFPHQTLLLSHQDTDAVGGQFMFGLKGIFIAVLCYRIWTI